MRETELHIFDFDGTLFKSPSPPKSYGKRGWWDDPRSLEPPCVPEKPGGEWYNSTVVSAFKKAKANPQAVTVVMTGRMSHFRKRVKQLCSAGGINPDELILKQSGGGATEAYKVAAMRYLLKQMPYCKKVEFWEDRHHHLKNFGRYIESKGYDFVGHPVKAQDRPATCDITPIASRVARRWMLDQAIKRVAGRPRKNAFMRFKVTSMKKDPKGVKVEGTFEFDERKAKGPFSIIWHDGRVSDAYFNKKRANRLGFLLLDQMKLDPKLLAKLKKLDK
jgi:hypothetical protein